MFRAPRLLAVVLCLLATLSLLPAQGPAPTGQSVDQKIDAAFKPMSDFMDKFIFFTVRIPWKAPKSQELIEEELNRFRLGSGVDAKPRDLELLRKSFPDSTAGLSDTDLAAHFKNGWGAAASPTPSEQEKMKFTYSVNTLFVVLWLAFAGVFLTLFFKFVNIRSFGLALRTVRGRYSRSDDPGMITHFQALSAAVSGTVGLGNIAGVAIGIYSGGPGVAFWLFLSGFLGMSSKFAECTLGVKYREIDAGGQVHGGAMYYLRKGLAERGLAPVGILLAFVFAVCCIFASFGGGNIFQVNQTTAQLISVTGGADSFFSKNQWVFGLGLAILTALVIIGGIRSIARVTDKLVPAMCLIYVVSALIVLVANAGAIPGAFKMIMTEAFKPRAVVTGGLLSAFIWGMRRATFSNEAGIGSAPIAHSVVKTRKPASEGVVALLEPFLDTVVICTLTALVLCVTMKFQAPEGKVFTINNQTYELAKDIAGDKNDYGIRMTSAAFETVTPAFKYVLFGCVFLFAFSTLITWSYYGLQAWQYIFGKSKPAEVIYKLIFCGFIVVGSAASLGNAVNFSDGSLFAMSIPNLIGVYILLPVVKREYEDFQEHARRIDSGT